MKPHSRTGKVARRGTNGAANLVSSPCFVIDKFVLRELKNIAALPGKTSVQVLVGLDGCVVIEADGMPPVTFSKGEAVVLPATVREYRLRPQWALECLRVSLPGETMPPPQT